MKIQVHTAFTLQTEKDVFKRFETGEYEVTKDMVNHFYVLLHSTKMEDSEETTTVNPSKRVKKGKE